MSVIVDEASPRTASSPRHRAFSSARIWALATNTLTELVRLKVFYFLLIFALLLIGSSAFLIRLSFQDQFQMLKDLSLGSMSIFTSLLAILATAGLLPKEIEDRTLYTVLAKPVSRLEYLLGKLLGVYLLLLITILLMGLVFFVMLSWRVHVVTGEVLASGGGADVIEQQLHSLRATAYNSNLWAGGITIYAKACLLASLTLFISTFASSSIFTVIVAVVVYFIGHMQATAREYWQTPGALASAGWLTKAFLGFVSVVFPDLQAFNLVDEIVVGTAIAPWLLAKTLGLGVLYCVIYVLAAYFVFVDKEL